MCTKFLGDGLCCGYDCLLSDDEPAQQHEEVWCQYLDESFRWAEYPDDEEWWRREERWSVLT